MTEHPAVEERAGTPAPAPSAGVGVLGPASPAQRVLAVVVTGFLAGVMLATALPEVARLLSLGLFSWQDFALLVGGTLGAASLPAAWRHGFRGLWESAAARLAVGGLVASVMTGLLRSGPLTAERAASLAWFATLLLWLVWPRPLRGGDETRGEESVSPRISRRSLAPIP